jgi:GNAT superfamily N-acetyltransferase
MLRCTISGKATSEATGEFAMPTETRTPTPAAPAHGAHVRRLWRTDRGALLAHLTRLDGDSRRLRFGGAVSDSFLAQYVDRCFGQGDLMFGAFVDGVLRGAAELRSEKAIWAEGPPLDRHIRAEAAFSVEPELRKRGIGEKLFARLQEAAQNHGVEQIEVLCLPENVAMRRLAAKFTASFRFEDDFVIGQLTPRSPTPYSMLREVGRDFVDLGEAAIDLQWRALRPSDAA